MGCDCRSHPGIAQEIQKHKIIKTPKLVFTYEYISVGRKRTSYWVHSAIWIVTEWPYMSSKGSEESEVFECLLPPKCLKDSILIS